MRVFTRKSDKFEKSQAIQPNTPPKIKVLTSCFCNNGHNLLSNLATFDNHAGITVKLRNEHQEGLLSMSPVIGAKDRSFFDTIWDQGEIVEICCPTCSKPLPIYNECVCGAELVAIFTTDKSDFANCIGICQRIGCTHADIKSNHDLRFNSRHGFFSKGYDLYGR